MEWFTIIALVLFGLALIVIEVIFIPGTTFIGLIGLAIAGLGIWQSFSAFGTTTGLIVLGISVLTAIGATVLGFKAGIWKRFALNDTHKSRFNGDIEHELMAGDEGITVSVLRPFGKAEFREKLFEVKTLGSYLESGTKVKIIKIQNQTIVVEALNS